MVKLSHTTFNTFKSMVLRTKAHTGEGDLHSLQKYLLALSEGLQWRATTEFETLLDMMIII